VHDTAPLTSNGEEKKLSLLLQRGAAYVWPTLQLLHFQHRLQRLFAKFTIRRMNPSFGRLDGARMLRQGGGAFGLRGVGDFAGFFGLVGFVFAFEMPNAAPALGFFRLRRRRRVDDRWQDVMARHGGSPLAFWVFNG
jgi:hypothetical protein